jgi:hypothetical protein
MTSPFPGSGWPGGALVTCDDGCLSLAQPTTRQMATAVIQLVVTFIFMEWFFGLFVL